MSRGGDEHNPVIEEQQKKCCCKQGGCCSNVPERQVRDEEGNIKRVNLAVGACLCCKTGLNRSGLDITDTDRIPPELLNRGFDLIDWQKWIDDLGVARELNNWSCTRILKAIFLPCLFCPCKTKDEILLSDKMLRQWQDMVNKNFERNGETFMFIKTRSHCMITYNDKGQRQRNVSYWLAVAMTEHEAQVLRNEPHLSGTVDDMTCCGGVNETELCWHQM